PGEYRVTATIRVYDAATGSLSSPCPTISTSVKTLTVYATSGIEPVIEFYHAGLDHYFLTQDANEIHDLDTAVHAAWGRTGQSFLAYLPGQTNGQSTTRHAFLRLAVRRIGYSSLHNRSDT